MKGHWILIIAAASGLTLAACNQAESPTEVREDVAEARAEGQSEVAEAQNEAQERMADAQQDFIGADDRSAEMDAAQEASETGAENEYRVAVAQAEASHRIANEKCDALRGEAQDDCKERADKELERAKRQAEMRRDGAG